MILTGRTVGRTAAAVGLPLALRALYRAVVSGQLVVDTGIGRSTRRLGPLTVNIAAPRETVFDVIAAPYLGRTPRALKTEIEVLERGSDMVLAAHYTQVSGMIATTVETVRFDRPQVVAFRLLRGPVPHVTETFELHAEGGDTRLVYTGELGTDFWALGRWWGGVVATKWVATVDTSLAKIAAEAERIDSKNR